MKIKYLSFRSVINLLVLLALFLSSALIVRPVLAATITVTTFADIEASDDECSLREAIIAANSGGDYMDCKGGSPGRNTIELALGDFTLVDQLPVITTEIIILGKSYDGTIIQASGCDPTDDKSTCTHNYRVLEVAANGNLTVQQVNIRHGDVSEGIVFDPGGGIWNKGILNIIDSKVTNNKAKIGGGVQNNSTQERSITVENSYITGNVATLSGGGVHNIKSSITLINSHIENNISEGGGGGIINSPEGNINLNNCTINGNTANTDGGGIYSLGILSLNNNTQIISNKAQQGGGLYMSGGIALTTIIRSIIEDNQANFGNGGGIYSKDALGLSIVRGSIFENEASGNGGGIFIYNGELSMEKSSIQKNIAGVSGGGVFIHTLLGTEQSAVIDDNCTFFENYAHSHGGAIFNINSQLTIEKTLFDSNTAELRGGAVYNISDQDPFFINASTLSRNFAGEYGGGVYNHNGSMTIDSTTLKDNTAEFNGGGLYNASDNGVMVLMSTLSRNRAEGLGGGIYNSGDDLFLENSTLSGNEAKNNSGGGIANYQGNISLRSCTLSDNTTNYNGGGIYNFNGSLDYANTIIANSVSDFDCYNSVGTITTDSHNLVVNNHNCGYPHITADPGLTDLEDNGGLTFTHALQEGSPAIDAGDPTECPDFDQRGVVRPQGEGCDIGAFEREQGTSIFLPLILR